jgi:murein L,D-transpeptidase YafK
VTRVLVKKKKHTMQLFAGVDGGREEMVASYRVAIGPGGSGPKRQEGDMITPVGRYHVTMHQPSQYEIFLRLDYPNAADKRRFEGARERGELSASAKIGGDIGIHGPPVALSREQKSTLNDSDWTAGCIAVDEGAISEIGSLVRDGTIVDIED